MVKKIFASIGLVILLFVVGVSVFAQPTTPPVLGPVTGPGTISGWVGILVTVVKWFYYIIFIVAVLFILLAAFHFITSKGDSETTKKAKQELIYAIVGIVVALLSYGVVTLVQNSLSSGLTQ